MRHTKNYFKQTLPFLLLLMTSTTFAQQHEVKQLEEVIEKLRAAMVTPDEKILNAIISDQLSYGHSSGRVEDKKSFVASLVSRNSDFVDITLSDQSISISSNTAVVRHTLAANTNDAGKAPGNVKLSVLTVWIKNQAGWVLLARQAVKI